MGGSQQSGVDLTGAFERLRTAYGPQGWWPGESPFEVAVGAILTQNTSWSNVERAVAVLRGEGLLSPRAMARVPPARLADLIRSAGYYNVKAERLGNFLGFLRRRYGLSMKRFLGAAGPGLRDELLEVKGIGPETADSILLYAAGYPVFVVDAYTRRVLARHGTVGPSATYGEIQGLFHRSLPRRAALYNEYHALIVRLGKERCRPRTPLCRGCPLGPAPPGLP